MRSKLKKPTPAQQRVLENLAAGKPAGIHCRSMSDHGGLHATLASLHRTGWLSQGLLTESGRAAAGSRAGSD